MSVWDKVLNWTQEKLFQIPGHSSVFFTELGDGQQPHYLQSQPETLHETNIPCSSPKLEHWCKVQQE